MDEFTQTSCILCKGTDEPLTVVSKGILKLIEYSEIVNDEHMKEYLMEQSSNNLTVKLHRHCQKSVYNRLKRKGSNAEPATQVKVTRSSIGAFNFKVNCIFLW